MLQLRDQTHDFQGTENKKNIFIKYLYPGCYYFKVAICATEDKLYVKNLNLNNCINYFVTSVHKTLLNNVSSQL